MSNDSMRRSSLQRRMALIFLLLLITIVIVTVVFVWRATYQHSTDQLQGHIKTSASVVTDKLTNTVSAMRSGLETIAKDFSLKQLLAGAIDDQKSLVSAMENFQARLETDEFWVLDGNRQTLVSSLDEVTIEGTAVDDFAQSGIVWFAGKDNYYLVQAVPVKFVESSVQVNGWLVMGMAASRLIGDELVGLTGMQISVFHAQSQQVISSTFSADKIAQLKNVSLHTETGLHEFALDGVDYIYGVNTLGALQGTPVYSVLATPTDSAYLSNQTLLIQLIIILLVAALLALVAAIYMSRSITRPLQDLIDIAKAISKGQYVGQFPQSNTKEVSTLTVAINDMQNGIIAREQEIHQLAFYDELTGLPNRLQFTQYIEQQIIQTPSQKLIILTLDVDRFKEINDTISHEMGDELLVMIAKRLGQLNEHQPFCARLGGDEFGIVFSASSLLSASELAAVVVALFDLPFSIQGLNLDIDCSIGVVVYPDHGRSQQELLQCADIAMYSCKEQHYRFAYYNSALNKHSVMRLSLMSELRGALQENQLQLFYQPKLSLHDNQVHAVECLIRWIHPQHGFIPPDEFIPLAEQTGTIRHVTHWALNTACAQLKTWQQAGTTLSAAVNISALDLVDMQLPTYIATLLTQYQLDPERLVLEVTESAVMGDPQNALKALNTLRSMGIILSIDDFGTGFSSMAQLKKMPVHELKIDKAFVLELAKSEDDQVMVKTLVALAQNLSLDTVAEGVEDFATLEFLREINCTKVQGFYLSKALNADNFNHWLAQFKAGKQVL